MTCNTTATIRMWFPGLILIGTACLTMSCATGCAGLSLFDGSLLRDDSAASIDDVQGPVERTLAVSQRNSQTRTESEKLAYREYEIAKQLYDAGDFNAAQKRFKKVIDRHQVDESGYKRKRSYRNWYKSSRELEANYYDNPLVEDSLFMLAESYYQQKELPEAETNYLRLLKQYPNTRHLDTSTQRLFDIALTWMQFKATTSADVELAAHSDSGPASAPQVVRNEEYRRPGFLNLTDPQRPWTDTEGRAIEALKAIWLNDPTGPLADDALMLTASHFLRIGRYSEAAETFRLLREEFPDSPHLKDAYVLGAYVTQASYQGADYNSQNLDESRALRMSALNLFPNLTPAERERLQTELQQVEDATIARYFETALFWLNKGQFDAVEMYCHYIINQFPDSKYARKSRGLLQKLPEFRDKNTLLLAVQGISADDIPEVEADSRPRPLPQTAPESTQPAPAPTPRMQPEAPTPSPITPREPEEPKRAPRYLPTWEIPKLKPIPLPKLWPNSDDPADAPESAPPFPGSTPTEPPSGRVNLTLGAEPSGM